MKKRYERNHFKAFSNSVNHKKLYKKGKNWVIGSLTLLALTGMGVTVNHSVHADGDANTKAATTSVGSTADIEHQAKAMFNGMIAHSMTNSSAGQPTQNGSAKANVSGSSASVKSSASAPASSSSKATSASSTSNATSTNSAKPSLLLNKAATLHKEVGLTAPTTPRRELGGMDLRDTPYQVPASLSIFPNSGTGLTVSQESSDMSYASANFNSGAFNSDVKDFPIDELNVSVSDSDWTSSEAATDGSNAANVDNAIASVSTYNNENIISKFQQQDSMFNGAVKHYNIALNGWAKYMNPRMRDHFAGKEQVDTTYLSAIGLDYNGFASYYDNFKSLYNSFESSYNSPAAQQRRQQDSTTSEALSDNLPTYNTTLSNDQNNVSDEYSNTSSAAATNTKPVDWLYAYQSLKGSYNAYETASAEFYDHYSQYAGGVALSANGSKAVVNYNSAVALSSEVLSDYKKLFPAHHHNQPAPAPTESAAAIAAYQSYENEGWENICSDTNAMNGAAGMYNPNSDNNYNHTFYIVGPLGGYTSGKDNGLDNDGNTNNLLQGAAKIILDKTYGISDTANMFTNMRTAREISAKSNWDMTKNSNASNMFANFANSTGSLNGSDYATSVGSELASVATPWQFPKNTNVSGMFSGTPLMSDASLASQKASLGLNSDGTPSMYSLGDGYYGLGKSAPVKPNPNHQINVQYQLIDWLTGKPLDNGKTFSSSVNPTKLGVPATYQDDGKQYDLANTPNLNKSSNYLTAPTDFSTNGVTQIPVVSNNDLVYGNVGNYYDGSDIPDARYAYNIHNHTLTFFNGRLEPNSDIGYHYNDIYTKLGLRPNSHYNGDYYNIDHLQFGSSSDDGTGGPVYAPDITGGEDSIPDCEGLFFDIPELQSVGPGLILGGAQVFDHMFASDPSLTDIRGLDPNNPVNKKVGGWQFSTYHGTYPNGGSKPWLSGQSFGNNFSDMFSNDTKLSDLNPISNWNTVGVIKMENMFRNVGNNSSKPLNVTLNWNVQSVKNMYNMFASMFNLSQIHFGPQFNPINCSDFSSMFAIDKHLNHLNLSNWNNYVDAQGHHVNGTHSAQDMSDMFNMNGSSDVDVQDEPALLSDITTDSSNPNYQNHVDFDTSNVFDTENMFRGLSNIKKLDLSSFTGQNLVKMNQMFNDDMNLHALNLSNLDTTHALDQQGEVFNADRFLQYMTLNPKTIFVNGSGLSDGSNPESGDVPGPWMTADPNDKNYKFYRLLGSKASDTPVATATKPVNVTRDAFVVNFTNALKPSQVLSKAKKVASDPTNDWYSNGDNLTGPNTQTSLDSTNTDAYNYPKPDGYDQGTKNGYLLANGNQFPLTFDYSVQNYNVPVIKKGTVTVQFVDMNHPNPNYDPSATQGPASVKTIPTVVSAVTTPGESDNTPFNIDDYSNQVPNGYSKDNNYNDDNSKPLSDSLLTASDNLTNQGITKFNDQDQIQRVAVVKNTEVPFAKNSDLVEYYVPSLGNEVISVPYRNNGPVNQVDSGLDNFIKKVQAGQAPYVPTGYTADGSSVSRYQANLPYQGRVIKVPLTQQINQVVVKYVDTGSGQDYEQHYSDGQGGTYVPKSSDSDKIYTGDFKQLNYFLDNPPKGYVLDPAWDHYHDHQLANNTNNVQYVNGPTTFTIYVKKQGTDQFHYYTKDNNGNIHEVPITANVTNSSDYYNDKFNKDFYNNTVLRYDFFKSDVSKPKSGNGIYNTGIRGHIDPSIRADVLRADIPSGYLLNLNANDKSGSDIINNYNYGNLRYNGDSIWIPVHMPTINFNFVPYNKINSKDQSYNQSDVLKHMNGNPLTYKSLKSGQPVDTHASDYSQTVTGTDVPQGWYASPNDLKAYKYVNNKDHTYVIPVYKRSTINVHYVDPQGHHLANSESIQGYDTKPFNVHTDAAPHGLKPNYAPTGAVLGNVTRFTDKDHNLYVVYDLMKGNATVNYILKGKPGQANRTIKTMTSDLRSDGSWNVSGYKNQIPATYQYVSASDVINDGSSKDKPTTQNLDLNTATTLTIPANSNDKGKATLNIYLIQPKSTITVHYVNSDNQAIRGLSDVKLTNNTKASFTSGDLKPYEDKFVSDYHFTGTSTVPSTYPAKDDNNSDVNLKYALNKSSINIHYVDSDGNPIDPSKNVTIQNVTGGTPFNIGNYDGKNYLQQSFNGYKQDPFKSSVTSFSKTNGATEDVYVPYSRESGTVTINYLDNSGNNNVSGTKQPLAEPVVKTGKVNDSFNDSNDLNRNFANYTRQSVSDHVTSYGTNPQTINVYYTRNTGRINLHYVDNKGSEMANLPVSAATSAISASFSMPQFPSAAGYYEFAVNTSSADKENGALPSTYTATPQDVYVHYTPISTDHDYAPALNTTNYLISGTTMPISSATQNVTEYSRSDVTVNMSASYGTWNTNSTFGSVNVPAEISSNGTYYHLVSASSSVPTYREINNSLNNSNANHQASFVNNVYYLPDSYASSTQSADANTTINYILYSKGGSRVASSVAENVHYTRSDKIDTNYGNSVASAGGWQVSGSFSIPSSYSQSGWTAIASNVASPDVTSLRPGSTANFSYQVDYLSNATSFPTRYNNSHATEVINYIKSGTNYSSAYSSAVSMSQPYVIEQDNNRMIFSGAWSASNEFSTPNSASFQGWIPSSSNGNVPSNAKDFQPGTYSENVYYVPTSARVDVDFENADNGSSLAPQSTFSSNLNSAFDLSHEVSGYANRFDNQGYHYVTMLHPADTYDPKNGEVHTIDILYAPDTGTNLKPQTASATETTYADWNNGSGNQSSAVSTATYYYSRTESLDYNPNTRSYSDVFGSWALTSSSTSQASLNMGDYNLVNTLGSLPANPSAISNLAPNGNVSFAAYDVYSPKTAASSTDYADLTEVVHYLSQGNRNAISSAEVKTILFSRSDHYDPTAKRHTYGAWVGSSTFSISNPSTIQFNGSDYNETSADTKLPDVNAELTPNHTSYHVNQILYNHGQRFAPATSSIHVHFIDSDGRQITNQPSDNVDNKQAGTPFTIPQPQINGYQYTTTVNPVTKFSSDNNHVDNVYVMYHNLSHIVTKPIVAHYVDSDNQPISNVKSDRFSDPNQTMSDIGRQLSNKQLPGYVHKGIFNMPRQFMDYPQNVYVVYRSTHPKVVTHRGHIHVRFVDETNHDREFWSDKYSDETGTPFDLRISNYNVQYIPFYHFDRIISGYTPGHPIKFGKQRAADPYVIVVGYRYDPQSTSSASATPSSAASSASSKASSASSSSMPSSQAVVPTTPTSSQSPSSVTPQHRSAQATNQVKPTKQTKPVYIPKNGNGKAVRRRMVRQIKNLDSKIDQDIHGIQKRVITIHKYDSARREQQKRIALKRMTKGVQLTSSKPQLKHLRKLQKAHKLPQTIEPQSHSALYAMLWIISSVVLASLGKAIDKRHHE